MKSPYQASMGKSIIKIITMLTCSCIIVYALGFCAKNHKITGIAPEHLGWFLYVSFFIVIFVVAASLAYVVISNIIDNIFHYLKTQKGGVGEQQVPRSKNN